MEAIFLPNQLANPLTRPYLLETLETFKEKLEEFAEREITDQALAESISIYNKNRGLLRQLYDMRRNRPGLIKLTEIVPIVQSSMIMPKEDHNNLLETLIPELAALVLLSRIAASPNPSLERRMIAMRIIEVIPMASAIQ